MRLGAVVSVLEGSCGDGAKFCAYGGLVHCGLLWSCPVCSARIRAERARDVAHVVSWHGSRWGGDSVIMLSLTVRHDWTDKLVKLRKGVPNAFRRFARGAPYLRFVERVGMVGSVRALEATHGANGWHAHIHVLLLVTNPRAFELERAWLADRWARCVERELGKKATPTFERGAVATVAHRDTYLTKLGLEVATTADKLQRTGHRAPFEVLSDVASEGRPEDVQLWRTWTRGMKGARMLTWSRGLRRAAGLEEEERTDEEIANDVGALACSSGAACERECDVASVELHAPGEGDGARCASSAPACEPCAPAALDGRCTTAPKGKDPPRVVLHIPAREWDAVRFVPGALAGILDAAEQRGQAGAVEALGRYLARAGPC